MQTNRAATGATGRKRVTIADVAADLGVTKSTVSRALNGYSDISEDTRQRITRAAERLGYRPLAHAQAIRTGRTQTLGLVLEIDTEDSARPFLADFLAGLTQAASVEGWTVTIAAEPSADAAQATLARLIDEHKADGFILPRTLTYDARIDALRAQGVPFVLFGRTANPTDCAWYDVQGEDAMQTATVRLARLGHGRIAHIPGGTPYFYSQLRTDGYKSGLAAAGLPDDDRLIGPPATTRSQGAAAARALLALPEPPTAIVCAVDRAALGVYQAATDLGLRIGRDLSLISYDGLPEGAYADPGLTTFAVDSRAAGQRLAQLLIARIRGTAPHELRELARATLVERGSDRPPALTSHQLAQRLVDRLSVNQVQWEDQQ